jgi:hypothetical protein
MGLVLGPAGGGVGTAGAGTGPTGPPGLAGAAGGAVGKAAVPGRETSLDPFGAVAGTQKWPLHRGHCA